MINKDLTIRRAEVGDMARINDLLLQVAKVHSDGRPDIFKSGAKKYTDDELTAIIKNDKTPIFVAVNSEKYLVGYAFCIYQETKDSKLLQDAKSLYIDDLCVDESCRGMHIGKALFDHVSKVAKESGCDSVTLNVWALNSPALAFYEHLGMTPQKIYMEKKI